MSYLDLDKDDGKVQLAISFIYCLVSRSENAQPNLHVSCSHPKEEDCGRLVGRFETVLRF